MKTDKEGSYIEKITKRSAKEGGDIAEKIYVTAGLYGEEYVEITPKSGGLDVNAEVSVSYEAEQKKSSSNNGGGRRMGPPM